MEPMSSDAGFATGEADNTPPQFTGREAATNENPEMDRLADANRGASENQGEQETIVAPASWATEMHASWDSLPSHLQHYLSDREQATGRMVVQQTRELSRVRPIVEMRDKYQWDFDRYGVSFEEGMAALMRAQELLDQDPRRGIAAIAQSYGIDLAEVFGPTQSLSPEVRRVLGENRRYEAKIDSMKRDQRAEQLAESRALTAKAESELQHWKTEKPYYEDVRNLMASFLSSGDAEDLESAYEMACHAHSDVREKVLQVDSMRDALSDQGQEKTQDKVAAKGELLDEDVLSYLFDQIVSR